MNIDTPIFMVEASRFNFLVKVNQIGAMTTRDGTSVLQLIFTKQVREICVQKAAVDARTPIM